MCFPLRRATSQGQGHQLFADLDDLIPFYRARSKNAPLLFAICAPCQPFTRLSKKELSGKRKRGRERDSNLLSEASGFVARYRPEMILSENVSSIKDPKYGGVWDEFRKTLEGLGYVTGSKVVCVSRFGVPQYRKRSILVAIRRELVRTERFADIMEQELLVPEADPNATLVSVAQAIGHLPPLGAGEAHPEIPNHRTRTLSDLNLKRISSAKPGESNAYMEGTEHGDLSLDCHRKVNERLNDRCFSDVYTRMSPNRPSPTITTKCHSISNGRFGHYDVDAGAGNIASRSGHPSVVPGRLRLPSRRADRAYRQNDRQRCAAGPGAFLCRLPGKLYRTPDLTSARSRFSSSSTPASIEHSQIVSTRQPAADSCSPARASLVLLRSSFSDQNSMLLDGRRPRGQSWPCQKQP